MNSILRAGLLLALAGNVTVSYAQGAAETAAATTPAVAAPAATAPAATAPATSASAPAASAPAAPAPAAAAPAPAVTPSLTTQIPVPAPAAAAAPAKAVAEANPAADAAKVKTPPKSQPVAMVPLTDKQKAAMKPDYDLFQAAFAGDTPRIRRLLGKGANVNAADWQYGFTPLMWAAKKGNLAAVRLLISRGANVNARSKVGVPLIFDSNVPTRDIFGGQLRMEQDLSRSFVIALHGGVSALHVAAASGWGMTARELLAHGANVNALDADGGTALFAAAYLNDVRTIKAMLAKGARMDIVNALGRDALWSATVHGSDNAVRELLARGAKPVADMRGEWPSDMARAMRFTSTAALLARPERLAKAGLTARKTDSAKSPARNVPSPDVAMTDPGLKGQGGIIILN